MMRPNITFNIQNSIAQRLLIMCLCFSEGHGKLTVFAMKAMLATMCGGKILDKLRCEYNAYNTAIQQLFYKDIIDIFCHKAEFI